ncbi:MAG: cyclic nucleotide-binding domain-containing protein [Deltaproteobacteria bacterium]|nr:cyclic nucleotide-binding domain-containing protein [Deltaproteobacteria bacterium]MBW2170852.1 cyclic nucleotide-binding domain-containing protein [Deltaproteobacteria bacterium]
MEKLADLRQHEVFGVFPDIQLSKLSEITEKRVYRKHEPIYKQGDRAKHLFLMRKGLVDLRDTKSGDLEGISVETLGPGQVFGIASLMKPHEHSLTAECLEDSEVLAIEANSLLEICRQEPDLGHWFMMTIAHLYFERYQLCRKRLFGPG